jgi:1,4-dihydroxy-2-naphthoate octaprenyltransferase
MATRAQWVAGARPRTLPAAISPVVVGTGAAAALHASNAGLAILALVVAVALQVGVNYANDYSDGIRGTDETRVGPVRLVGQHLARADNVKLAAFACFGLSALAGLALVALSGAWLLIPVGLLAILAAWWYTGGSSPYGYRGLGEVFVFVFFGLVATLGTMYTQADRLSWPGLLGAVGVGAIAAALLVANNLRDIPTDTMSGKRTLAVRLGDRRTRLLYFGLVAAAFGCAAAIGVWWHPWAYLALASFGPAARPVRTIWSSATGRDLVPALAGTGRFELGYAVLLAIGLAVQPVR